MPAPTQRPTIVKDSATRPLSVPEGHQLALLAGPCPSTRDPSGQGEASVDDHHVSCLIAGAEYPEHRCSAVLGRC